MVAVGLRLSEPESPFAPLHPFDAVQEVAFVDVHASVEAEPCCTLDGVAVRVSVGSLVEVQNEESISGRPSLEPITLCLSQRRLIAVCDITLSRVAADAVENANRESASIDTDTNPIHCDAVILFPIT